VRRVVQSDQAQVSLTAIRGYIAEFSPLAAQRFALKLVAAAEDLAHNPDRGRPVGDVIANWRSFALISSGSHPVSRG
jgi:plasmid stabilization system protein ParE